MYSVHQWLSYSRIRDKRNWVNELKVVMLQLLKLCSCIYNKNEWLDEWFGVSEVVSETWVWFPSLVFPFSAKLFAVHIQANLFRIYSDSNTENLLINLNKKKLYGSLKRPSFFSKIELIFLLRFSFYIYIFFLFRSFFSLCRPFHFPSPFLSFFFPFSPLLKPLKSSFYFPFVPPLYSPIVATLILSFFIFSADFCSIIVEELLLIFSFTIDAHHLSQLTPLLLLHCVVTPTAFC